MNERRYNSDDAQLLKHRARIRLDVTFNITKVISKALGIWAITYHACIVALQSTTFSWI